LEATIKEAAGHAADDDDDDDGDFAMYLAEYDDPRGGGGVVDDYVGASPLEKDFNWSSHQKQIFMKRWKLQETSQMRWDKATQREYAIWLMKRIRNKPDFWTVRLRPEGAPKTRPSSTLDEVRARSIQDQRGRSLRTSGFLQIYGPDPQAQPLDDKSLPRPSASALSISATIDPFADRPPGGKAKSTYADDAERLATLNPFETVLVPNPIPRPPARFTIWNSWPQPTCPPANPPESPLPESFSLLCPDGERRDFFGPFGLDSFLAKVRQLRTVAFSNYCILRNPGLKPGLRFEVVDSGYNKFIYDPKAKEPLLIKMSFRFHVLANEAELTSYLC